MGKTVKLIDQVFIPQGTAFGESSLLKGDIGDQPNQPTRGAHLFINTKMEFQTIQGIGGAFSEQGGKALSSLPEEKQDEVAKALFEENLTYFRLPVGSSDFGLDAYSFNDTKDDFEMEHFSIDRDRNYVLPYMNACKKYCNDMKVHASPWAPPYWMKENQMPGSGSALIDTEENYTAYAKYVGCFLDAYKEAGFPISRYCIQNEPDVDPAYPSCQISAKQMGTFIPYLSKHLSAKACDTEIWAGTFRSINGSSACEFLSENPDCISLIKGVASQYTMMQPLYEIGRNYPMLSQMHTESNCFHGENSWEQAIVLFLNIVEYYQAGCDTFTYWNMILNQESTSTWGWKQNSLVKIDEETHEIIYNPDYSIMSLAAKCMTAGSKRVIYSSMNKRGIAVTKPDGTMGFLVSNFSDKKEDGEVTVDGTSYELSLAPYSISYFEM